MIYSQFGETLRALRKNRGLTQKELGAKIGLSKAVVSKYENDLGYPTLDVVVKIAAFFNVTTDFLLGVQKGKTLDVTGLSDSQIAILNQLITEFKKSKKV